jgi:hypothetical protein
MSKRKKITDVEKFYIQQNPENLTNEQLAEKVQCASTVISQLRPVVVQEVEHKEPIINVPRVNPDIHQNKDDTPVQPTKVEPQEGVTSVYNGPKAKDFIGTDKTGKRGYAIMTPQASTMADEHAKFNRENRPSKSLKGMIHKPRG